MTEQMTNYQCPSCRGSMTFDPASGKVKCDYCASLFTIEEVKAYFAKENENAVADSDAQAQKPKEEAWGETSENLKEYECKSCGAHLVTDDTTAATSCPYCGNPTVIPQQFAGMLRPKYVIPFKVDKEEAKGKLTQYYKGKKLLPKTFTEGNHLEEVKGVYVPFWLCSGSVEADVSYKAEEKEEKNNGNEVVITTRHYDVRRKGIVHFDKIPTDASSRMPDDLMDSIEPYDYTGIKDFEMEYLPGYLADKYDVAKEQGKERAQKRAQQSVLDLMRDSLDSKYDAVHEESGKRQMRFFNTREEYAMMPVWLLSTKWNDQNFLFAINGQTGKMTGNLPVDKKKLVIWVLLVSVLAFLASFAFFGTESMLPAVILTLIAGFATHSVLMSGMRPVSEKRAAREYVDAGKASRSLENMVKFSIKEDNFIRTTTERRAANRS